MPFKIFIDSCADLSQQYVQAHDLGLSMMIYTSKQTGDVSDDLGQSCSYHDFYNTMRGGAVVTTSQINAATFQQDWTPTLAGGQDLLYIAFSSALSGTYQSACIARDELLETYPARKIVVVDSRSASMGLGLLTHYVVMMRDQGAAIEECAQWIETHRDLIHHWFTVEDLVYLRRSGRLSAAAAFAGSILQLKPVLHCDSAGRLVPIYKTRGRKKALAKLVDMMVEAVGDKRGDEIGPVFISHADSPDDARKVADDVQARLGVRDITIGYIGPTIGSHAGPGTVALFFMGAPRESFKK
nr:DegV family protein [Maliibacterium massiliense]